MKRVSTLLATLLALVVFGVSAQDERRYQEGPVIEVTSVRVQDGQWDTYMAYLADRYRPVLEEQKKAGLILDYGVFAAYPRHADEPNLYLTVTYPNMASFDGLEDKTEPLARKVTGQSRAQAEKAFADRQTMREILGSELVRELTLK